MAGRLENEADAVAEAFIGGRYGACTERHGADDGAAYDRQSALTAPASFRQTGHAGGQRLLRPSIGGNRRGSGCG
jgi:hypothetical protein